MGTYLNPGNQNFREFVDTGRYVDKTMLIDLTNSRLSDPTFKFVCVSRPRRLGKPIASDLLAAYYSKGADSRDLFAPYTIAGTADFGKNLNKFNVVYIDLNAVCANWVSKEVKPDSVIYYLNDIVREDFRAYFTDISFSAADSLADCILRAYSQKGETFIIIIDEYDVLLREQVSEKELEIYRAFLNSLFKSKDLKAAIPLAYLTGILPIMKDKVQSKLNTFRPYSMLYAGEFSEFVGFTSEEVESLCKKYGCDYDLCKSWYDGYRLGEFEVYNPEAVMEALMTKDFRSYWSGTSTYAVVAEKISMNFGGIKEDVISMLAGKRVSLNAEMYDNTMSGFRSRDDVFAFLIHLGYLAYDAEERECYIPNREIHQEWQKAIKNNSDYEVTNSIIHDSKKLLEATLAGDEDAVAAALDCSHTACSSSASATMRTRRSTSAGLSAS